MTLGEFHDVEKHCISYQTKSLIFTKQELLIVYSYKFICVYIVSFYANITKIGTRSHHYGITQSKPDKEGHVAAQKNCFI